MSNIVDLMFKIQGDRLPVDHAWALSQAVIGVLPWMKQDEQSGIHQVHILESGSGWQRPTSDSWMYLSKRTHFMLRVPMDRVEDSRALCGKTLKISDCNFSVGEGRLRYLSPLTTLYAHHVVIPSKTDSEDALLESFENLLRQHKIEPVHMLCGRQRHISTPKNVLQTRSLMVAELKPEESLTLQQIGLGPCRKLGCGLFLPHKGIAPVPAFINT